MIGLDEWRLRPPTLRAAWHLPRPMVCTLLLSCALTTLTNITLMWTVSADGTVVMLTALVTLFSEMVLPVLFPVGQQPALMAMPFAGLVDLPYRVYVGNIAPSGIPAVIVRQLLWTAALVLFGRWLLARGLRRVVVQGG